MTKKGTKKAKSLGALLIEGLREGVAARRGELELKTHLVRVMDVDVAAIRKRLGLSQKRFADVYRLPITTLRNWEQGIRRPDTPAQVLLTIIAHAPEVAEQALIQAAKKANRRSKLARQAST